jgi:muramoyltetrapeptide carboxypeptidase
MISPPPLQPGDAVALVATARKVTPGEMQPAIQILERWGFRAVAGGDLFKSENQFAGGDEHRAASFQRALDDPAIRAVLFARGGYGTVRIIDKIDFSAFKTRPKWLIGFSDLTVVHNRVQKHCGVQAIHGPMAINFAAATKEALDALEKTLKGQPPALETPASALNRKGECGGVLTGGNLSVLYSLNGSRDDIDPSGKVLFIEDLDEHLYHVDRMLMNLKRAGKLAKLAGLIVGDVSEMRDHTKTWGFAADIPFGKTAEEIIREHVAEYDYPVCFGLPAGHQPYNLPLVMGADVNLQVRERVTLSYAHEKVATDDDHS